RVAHARGRRRTDVAGDWPTRRAVEPWARGSIERGIRGGAAQGPRRGGDAERGGGRIAQSRSARGLEIVLRAIARAPRGAAHVCLPARAILARRPEEGARGLFGNDGTGAPVVGRCRPRGGERRGVVHGRVVDKRAGMAGGA